MSAEPSRSPVHLSPHELTPRLFLWQRLAHPYTAAGICCFLLIVPYFFDFSMPILFPEYQRFATVWQHLAISSLLSVLILGGTIAGICSARRSPEKRTENLAFFLSPMAPLVFGGLLLGSWAINLSQLPVSVSALTRGATAARASIKELGGLSFIGHLYLISLPAALVCLRLRGKGIRAVTIVTFVAAFLVAFSTAERLGLIECLVAFVIFMGLYQPRLLRVWVVTLVSTLAIVFLILNLLWRTLPSLPPAMVDQAYPLLPKIAAGTFLTYYTDTMNKLYFDIFTKYYDTSLEDKFFMKTPDSFLARFQSKFGETRALGNAYVPAQGNYVSLDFLHGRNIMMTNPGGPAEDFLDFGWMMFLMAFAKYFLFGRIYVGARNFAPLSVALYPVFFLSALDYPRVNHLYEVRGAMAVLTACVLIPLAIVLNKRLRQAGEPALRPA